jgi:hypothetical protein
MMNFLRKNMQVIFYITLGGFFAGIFVGFGGYFFGGGATQGLAAEVNGQKIPMRRYNQLLTRTLDNLRSQKVEPTDEMTRQKKHEVMQDLIQEEVFWQEAWDQCYRHRSSNGNTALSGISTGRQIRPARLFSRFESGTAQHSSGI